MPNLTHGQNKIIAIFVGIGALAFAATIVTDMKGNWLWDGYRVAALLVLARGTEVIWRRGATG